MFSRRTLFPASVFLSLALAVTCVNAEPIKAYTAHLPPYSIAPDLEHPGIAHEIAAEMAQRAGVELEVEYLPWSRALNMVEKQPGVALFPAARTATREDTLGWVGHLISANQVFVSKGAPVNSMEDAKKLSKIAVLNSTVMDKILTGKGFENLSRVNSSVQAVKLVQSGRVDAWFAIEQETVALFKADGIDPSVFTFGETIQEVPLWLATNHSFDAETAAALAAALDSMKADGSYDAIVAHYLD
ncbi:ABC transporter substrate-binding protein [Phaeobacter sp. HF9A]|uniref:substrate-binding periplasmic protein n=1 Tax=Phaeobacter sp. HF9A TaxID=2721561 RepID=UPI001430E8EA|nr:transporter substrate-binding domain-containing protein [Phaeobacter sp. HF9A]NIZ13890.1 amino acid ABC transporter substrate-binding protein [Phaeobacter sp. HF9A]